jgi:hypothetical protein
VLSHLPVSLSLSPCPLHRSEGGGSRTMVVAASHGGQATPASSPGASAASACDGGGGSQNCGRLPSGGGGGGGAGGGGCCAATSASSSSVCHPHPPALRHCTSVQLPGVRCCGVPVALNGHEGTLYRCHTRVCGRLTSARRRDCFCRIKTVCTSQHCRCLGLNSLHITALPLPGSEQFAHHSTAAAWV